MPLKESTFIARNLETWQELERELDAKAPDPDRLRKLYTATSADLSYARTHYTNRSIRSYLNHKAVGLSLSLNRNQRSESNFLNFWTKTVPLEIYTQRRVLIFSALLFFAFFMVGWISNMVDPTFAEKTLSYSYVEMTRDNIKAGDPMGVYKDDEMLGMSLRITANNIIVSLLAFITGITFGIGTLYLVIVNGVMVGSFQQFFFSEGVGWESVVGIWTHGTIEISAIIMASGAGFVLAKGLLFPGTLPRSRAFQLTALSGLRLMAAIIPLFVIAGFIEGFITRQTDLPMAIRVFFLLINLTFIVVYLILRPYQIGRKTERPELDYGTLPESRVLDLAYRGQRSVSDIFFTTLRYLFGTGFRWLKLGALAAIGTAFLWEAVGKDNRLIDSIITPAIKLTGHPVGPGVMVLLLLPLFLFVLPYLSRHVLDALPSKPHGTSASVQTIHVGLAIPWLIVMVITILIPGVLAFTMPFLAVWLRSIHYHGGRVGTATSDTYSLIIQNFGIFLLLGIIFGIFILMIDIAMVNIITDLAVTVLISVLPESIFGLVSTADAVQQSIGFVLYVFYLFIWVVGYGVAYTSFRESHYAESLQERFLHVFNKVGA